MKLRYIALILLLIFLTPMLRKTIEYAAIVKSRYDTGKQVEEMSGKMLAWNLTMKGK